MNTEQPLEQIRRRILEIVASPGYRPKKPKMFLQELGLTEEDRSIIRRIIKRMVKEGLLAFGKSHLVHPPGQKSRDGGVSGDDDAAAVPKGYAGKAVKTKPSREKPGKKRKTFDDVSREKDERKAKRDAERWQDRESTGQYLVGTFRRKPSGIGFVRLKNADPENPVPDIYVAAHFTQDAASGDTVAVELLAGRTIREERERNRRQRLKAGKTFQGPEFGERGRVLKVLKRATDRFVGTFYEEEEWGFVRVDGDRFANPLVVGDPGATVAQPGDKVVVEMLVFPDAHRNGEAVIVEVLGRHGAAGLDTLLILREFDLPDQFTEETLAEARRQVHDFFRLFPDDAAAGGANEAEKGDPEEPIRIPDDRVDITEELIITIDPADAKDFDDAISLVKTEEGNWRLGVHIADVAYFVGEGGAIDREAKDRGTSVYLPDRVIPMLPEVLCNALASLQPGKRRLAKSVYIEFTPEGIRTDVAIQKTLIRSTRRFNYTEVQEFFDKPGAFSRTWSKPIREMLLRMRELAMLLRRRRFERGAIEMNMPEVKIDLDEDGQVVGAHEYPYYDSNRLIEEFMLAANEAVADFLFRRNILFLRRVHRFPALKKMKAFADFLRSLEIDDLDPEKMIADRHLLQSVLDKVKGKPEEKAVHFALLRSMQRAEYSPNGEGHYALASDCYTHFTSPIRRYPDLTIHRLIELVLQGRDPKPPRGPLVTLGEHCSDRERRAESAENELTKLKLIDYLSKRIGVKMEGFVTGIESFGLFVQGIEIPAEGLVRLETLCDDYYRFDRSTHTLSGARVGNVFRLGDRVRIEVVRADADSRQIDFRLLERISKPRGTSTPRKPPPARRR